MKIKIKAKLAHRCVAIVSLMFKLANNNKLHNFYAATSSQQFKFNVVWLFQRPRAATTLFLIGRDWSDLIKENFAFAICKIQKKKKKLIWAVSHQQRNSAAPMSSGPFRNYATSERAGCNIFLIVHIESVQVAVPAHRFAFIWINLVAFHCTLREALYTFGQKKYFEYPKFRYK